jgi:hypothetical protein
VPDGPPRELLAAVAAVVEPWLERLVVATARARLRACPPELAAAAADMARREAPAVLDELAALLATDVDDQRANPLAVLRGHVAPANDLLRDAAVPVPRRDEFDARHFPDDAYGLGPATWRDVDESLHEPGLVWGAWKAATVLARRRAEGRR